MAGARVSTVPPGRGPLAVTADTPQTATWITTSGAAADAVDIKAAMAVGEHGRQAAVKAATRAAVDSKQGNSMYPSFVPALFDHDAP